MKPSVTPARRAVAAAALVTMTIAGFPGVGAQTRAPEPKRDAGGVAAPTAELERGRTVYVLSACHFCHGVDLTGAQMGAADLMHIPMVGQDRDGDVIGAIVKAGLPNLQTAMPAYRDLTSTEITELARYIHYLRRQGLYKEFMQTAAPAGDAAAGRDAFSGAFGCAGCHSLTGDLKGIAGRYDPAALRARFLRPGAEVAGDGAAPPPGLAAHERLLENYTPAAVQNLMAFLLTLR